jgi:hypothetical protein
VLLEDDGRELVAVGRETTSRSALGEIGRVYEVASHEHEAASTLAAAHRRGLRRRREQRRRGDRRGGKRASTCRA